MNILLLGSGGRESTLAWKMSLSAKLKKLYIAPGNGGTLSFGENVNININDFDAIYSFSIRHDINMIVVGSEEPLVNGIKDYFLDFPQIKVVGPSKASAMLEGSKDFSKEFMAKYNIPTASYQTFTKDNISKAYKFLETLKAPYVLKADGLAAGKGVIITENIDEAKTELDNILLSSKFGKAGNKVVIEEYLKGIELSFFVVTDGISYKVLPQAKDYKRIGEGDTGLNTGGMGCISPVPFADQEFVKKVEERIVIPTIQGLKNDKIEYSGFLFIGLMNVDGNPFVIEYNVRLGDPETEVIIPRLKTDIVDLFEAIVNKNLSNINIEIFERCAATVMLVSEGYPENYKKNFVITGLDKTENSFVFHAGTRFDEESSEFLTSGGRVMAITSFGNNIDDAVSKSLKTAEVINFENKYYRHDIGKDLMKYEK